MEPVATPVFFYAFAFVAIVSAILVITVRNPVHSAISLIFTLLSLAGFYLMLYAPFVAGVQIILYVGGIMVLFLFVIMLVNIERAQREEQFNKQWHVAIASALVLGALFVYVYLRGDRIFAGRPFKAFEETSNTQAISIMLFRDYFLAFEIASLLLLVAIIGAVVMAKRKI